MKREFRQWNLAAWTKQLQALFPYGIPDQASWKRVSEIVSVLTKLGRVTDLCHAFLPTGGGLDLAGAAESWETECVELKLGAAVKVVRASELSFEGFHDDLEWSYFRLECSGLKPTGVYEGLRGPSEELVEIVPGEYEDRSIWDSGVYYVDGQETPLPRTARLVRRFLEGRFVLFAKGSLYNRNTHTYDGRHNGMTAEGFRVYIRQALESARIDGTWSG